MTEIMPVPRILSFTVLPAERLGGPFAMQGSLPSPAYPKYFLAQQKFYFFTKFCVNISVFLTKGFLFTMVSTCDKIDAEQYPQYSAAQKG